MVAPHILSLKICYNKFMYYVYLLRSQKTQKVYIGQTADLKRRFEQHNSGKELSTKNDLPWELIYYEAYKNRSLAMERERKLKHYGQSLRRLKERIGF